MIRETGFGSIRKVPAGLLAEQWLRVDLQNGDIRPPFARGLRVPGKPGLWAPPARRVVPLEAAIAPGTPTSYDGGSDQNHSFAIDTGAGSDRYLLIGYAVESSSPANGIPSTITYDGVSLESLVVEDNGDDMVVGAYGLHNPASGSNAFVFNLPANPPGELTIGYQTFSGVHQGSVPSDSVRATASDGTPGSSFSLTLTSCLAGDYCIWVAGDFDDTSHTASGSAVERLDTNFNPTGANLWYGTFAVTSDGNVTGGAGGGGDMIGVAVALIPAAEATEFELDAESGAYAWTGQAAALLKASEVDAESGAYLWTPQDVAFVKGFSLSAEATAYSWAGQVADLLSAFKVAADSGSYAWTGQDAALLYEIKYSLDAGEASYVWTGSVVTLSHDIDLQPGNKYTVRIKQRESGQWRLTEIIFQSVSDGFWDVLIKLNGRWVQRQLLFTG